MSRPRTDHPTAAPWTLVVMAGVAAIAIGLLGLNHAAAVAVISLAVLFMIFLLRHLAFAASALSTARLDMRGQGSFDYGYRPRVSVMVPCRNEELVIEGMLSCLLALDYPAELLELLVIDDGSDDRTGAILDETACREPRLRVIHRARNAGGGKSGALNTALVEATGDVILVFDADHKPRADVLRRLVRHFADPRVGAVQGRCIVRNGEESNLARTIAVDYYSGYLVNEYGRQALYGLPAYGGANCAVRTSTLRALGGWNPDTVTEDTDLTLRLLLRGEVVRFDVTAIDTEESVPTLKRFWNQRYRWARGHQQAWREYRSQIWKSRNLTPAQKIETTMFLLVYHVPVACGFGAILIIGRALGLLSWCHGLDLTPIATLLFLGPLLELASGLVVSRAPRRAALAVPLFLPSFVLFTVVCTKAWIDGLLNRPYSWSKTPRTGHGQTPAQPRVAEPAVAA
jgi:1,2-diacylglycerol 3-beta-glucosyltransferase